MPDSADILQLLADGRFHSGEAIAVDLGCSRSAVCKQIANLRTQTGLRIDAVTGRGYRLQQPLDLLDRQQIESHLGQHRHLLEACHVAGSVDSTNELAKQERLVGPAPAVVWLAEHQTAGRGRRGRQWLSPYGTNLYLSLAYRFDLPLMQLAGLSLAVGATLADRLCAYGLRGHGLKWPNDVLWQSRKLAGILLEALGEHDGPAIAVIGVGLNVQIDQATQREIDQPVASLQQAGIAVSRNRVAGELIADLLDACQLYQREGLPTFLGKWQAHDLLRGQRVQLSSAESVVSGEYLGIDSVGALRLKIGDDVKSFYGGEVSLRAESLV